MQKMHWWRVGVLLLGCLVFGWGYLVTQNDNLDGWYNAYTDPSMFLSLSLIFVSVIMFFVDDTIFRKWLYFTILWLVLTVIFIFLAPEYQGGWLGIGPEKESVSIRMSILFVILSLVNIAWDSWKIRRSQGIV